MQSTPHHKEFVVTRRNRRSLVVLVASLCLPLGLTGMAVADPAFKAGDTPAEFGMSTPAPPLGGDTPADFGKPAPAAPRGGDTPADFPGASRSVPYSSPTRVEIVRPQRTIVRDVDEVLPIILASLALLLALGGFGVAIRGNRVLEPAGRSQ